MAISRSTYDSVAVRRLLGISNKMLSDLRITGSLLVARKGKGRRPEYDKQYIDYLAQRIALYPAGAYIGDPTLFQLSTLQWQFNNAPDGLSAWERKKYHRSIRSRCHQLVSQGEAYLLADLGPLIGKEYETLRRWGERGLAAFVAVGRVTYVSRRQRRQLIKLFTTWPTLIEAAISAGVSEHTIRSRVSRGSVKAVMCPDGEYRMEPATVLTLISPTVNESGERLLTIGEMAKRLGVREGAVRLQVSLGGIASVGEPGNPRILESEVMHWENYFSNLNKPFAWLQPLIVLLGKKPQTLSTRQGARLLDISEETLSGWSRAGLVPYFPRSFTRGSGEIRDFVRLYLYGLQSFAGKGKVSRETARRYLELCKKNDCII